MANMMLVYSRLEHRYSIALNERAPITLNIGVGTVVVALAVIEAAFVFAAIVMTASDTR